MHITRPTELASDSIGMLAIAVTVSWAVKDVAAGTLPQSNGRSLRGCLNRQLVYQCGHEKREKPRRLMHTPGITTETSWNSQFQRWRRCIEYRG
jgi:hypothetical protein